MTRRKKITLTALEVIPVLIDQGMSADEIARAVGCTVGTLRVKCSHMGISLRRKHPGDAKQDVRHAAACKGARVPGLSAAGATLARARIATAPHTECIRRDGIFMLVLLQKLNYYHIVILMPGTVKR